MKEQKQKLHADFSRKLQEVKQRSWVKFSPVMQKENHNDYRSIIYQSLVSMNHWGIVLASAH